MNCVDQPIHERPHLAHDPVLGMFVTPDSIVQNMFDPQDLNRYSYCRNNPLIYTDPSGHRYVDPRVAEIIIQALHNKEMIDELKSRDKLQEELEETKKELAAKMEMEKAYKGALDVKSDLEKAYGKDLTEKVFRGGVTEETVKDLKTMQDAVNNDTSYFPDTTIPSVEDVKAELEHKYGLSKPDPNAPKSEGDYDNDSNNPSNHSDTDRISGV